MKYEEWYGIQVEDIKVQDSGDEVMEDTQSEGSEAMEDGNINISDSEELVGNNEEIIYGLDIIW